VQAQQEQLQAQQESVGVMKQLRSVLHGEDAHRRIVRARGGRSKLLWKVGAATFGSNAARPLRGNVTISLVHVVLT
jgi:hypothetical protein